MLEQVGKREVALERKEHDPPMSVGELIVELPDILRSQFLGIRRIDDAGADLDDEIPSGTQEFRISPGAAYTVSVALEGAFIETYAIVCIKQRRRDELTDISLDEPVPPARLDDNMAPLCVSELERIDRHRDVDRIVQICVHIDGRVNVAGCPSDHVGRNGRKLTVRGGECEKRQDNEEIVFHTKNIYDKKVGRTHLHNVLNPFSLLGKRSRPPQYDFIPEYCLNC